MPHVTIEYSANVGAELDIDQLVASMHEAVVGLDLARLAGIRTRAVRRDAYRVADGDPRYGYVAITARLGPGRDPSTKHQLMGTLLDAGEAHVEASGSELLIAWSAEVQEIDAEFRVNRNRIAPDLVAKSESSGD